MEIATDSKLAEPLRVYYRSVHGRWLGAFCLRISDPAGLRVAPIPWLDRFRARSTAALRSVRMETTLDYGVAIVHTTRVSAFGVPLLRSEERFSIEEGGRAASMHGTIWYPPLPWPSGHFGDGRVDADDDGRGATYRFRAFGGDVVQRTRLEDDDALRLIQDLGWGRGEVLLRRISRELRP